RICFKKGSFTHRWILAVLLVSLGRLYLLDLFAYQGFFMSTITTECPQLLIEQDQGVLTLRFNRPERKNALSRAIYAAAADVLHQADADTSVRVIIIAGSAECVTRGTD